MSTKQEWGNACWHLIHGLTFKMKTDDKKIIDQLMVLLYNVCVNLPCPECSEHAKETFTQARNNGIKVNSLDELQAFWWKFHNLVNMRTGKEWVLFEDAKSKYEKARLFHIVNNFVRIMKRNIPGERSMMYSMSRNNAVEKMFNFIKENQASFDIIA